MIDRHQPTGVRIAPANASLFKHDGKPSPNCCVLCICGRGRVLSDSMQCVRRLPRISHIRKRRPFATAVRRTVTSDRAQNNFPTFQVTRDRTIDSEFSFTARPFRHPRTRNLPDGWQLLSRRLSDQSRLVAMTNPKRDSCSSDRVFAVHNKNSLRTMSESLH
jgi:hypothetical protein